MSRYGPNIVALLLVIAVLGGGGWVAWRTLQSSEGVAPPARELLIKQPNARVEVPSGWFVVEGADGFSVYAPPGTSFHHVDGIDWLAGEFDSSHFSFRYYRGYHPEALHEVGGPLFGEESVVIDGRRGIIQRYTYTVDRLKDGRRWYSRLLLADAFQHYDYGSSHEALDLYGRADSPAAQTEMEQTWRSIRFVAQHVKELNPVPHI